MKKLLSVILCLSMLLAVGCSAKESTATPSPTVAATSGVEVQSGDATGSTEKKVLRVGMECAYPPFNWSQETATVGNGATAPKIYGTELYAYGYDVMMAQKLADQLGWDLEIHRVEWASIGLGLDVGDYDVIIAGMGYTEDRAKLYEFTDPYYIRSMCLTVKADGRFADVTKLSDFEGQNPIAITQMGTAFVDFLSDIPSVKTATNYETTGECFMAIATGAAEVCMIDYPTSKSALLTNPGLKIIEWADPKGDALHSGEGGANNVCIAIKKGNTELRDQVQAAMTAINWSEDKMNAQMDEVIVLQPAAN
jgi:putative lysine transport system substrate-binding protein